MTRVSIPGVESLRSQLDIAPEDPDVFRPILPAEAIRAARIVLRDDEIPKRLRKIGVVGILFDLMPGHLRPSWPLICEMLSLHRSTLSMWELEWESTCDETMRFHLVARSYRAIVAERAAARRS